MQLHQMIEQFVKQVCAGKTNETPTAYRSKMRHLVKFLGSDCEVIDQGAIDKFKQNLLERDTKISGGKEIKKQLSKFTIRTVLQTTAHFLRWACKNSLIPAIALENIPEPDPEPKPIQQTTFERLLLAAERTGEPWEQTRNIALLYVLRDTGGRAGSIAALDVESIVFVESFALVKDKGDKTSRLWFSDQTLDAIREWLKWRDQLNPTDYRLFTGAKGAGLTRLGIARMLDRLADAAGVHERHNAHSFRHAFARDALLAGADLGQVSELLNHRGIAVTHKYYARWSKAELKDFHHKFGPGRLLPKRKK